MDEPPNRRATYDHILRAPRHNIAAIVDGELLLSPRPAGPYAAAATALSEEFGRPFKRGRVGQAVGSTSTSRRCT